MDPAEQRRWRAADDALDRLLDLPREQRGAALAALPDDIRGLAGRLLAAHERDGLLDAPPLLAGSAAAEALLDLPGGVPRRIGAWQLGEVLGRGGMSIVYAAQRALPAGSQQAALKLLTVAALATDGRRRFLREHRVLARLTHPRIAALLDAGVLDDGTPYLAMQRVDGQRIDAWCRERGLDVRAIVTLFLQVCEAVAYAHRQLVVHRDLKPSNVLVDEGGTVRLLDFGIARLLDEAADGEETRTEFRALTPQYAAPEQFRGEDSGTAADVFGLGAVLYQLLTGRPPRLPQQDREGQITQPSRAAQDSEALSTERRPLVVRQLRGDLDAVLLRALHDDPSRRYPDAASLAADLRRWLQARPVRAARAGRLYRARKFVARHRGAVAATLLVLGLLPAGVAVTWWQAQRVAAEAARAEQVKGFLVSLLQSASPEDPGGRVEDTAEVLARGAVRARETLADTPALQAELLVLVGRLQVELGRFEAAAETLASARTVLSDHGKALPPRLAPELALAQARLHSASGDPMAMRDGLLAALAEIPASNDPAARQLRGMLHLNLGHALAELGDTAAAGTEFLRAERVADGLGGERRRSLLQEIAFYRGMAASRARAFDEALAQLQRALALLRQAPRPDPASEADVLTAIATAHGRHGDLDAAIARQAEVVALTRRLYPAIHPWLGGKLALLATWLTDAGRLAEAEPLSAEALAIRRATLPAGSVRLANSLHNHAILLVRLGQSAAALPLLAEAQQALDEQLGATDFRTLMVLAARARAGTAALPEAEVRGLLAELDRRLAAVEDPAHPVLQVARLRALHAWFLLGDYATLFEWQARFRNEHGFGQRSIDAVNGSVLELRALLALDRTAEAAAVGTVLHRHLDEAGAELPDYVQAEAWAALGQLARAQGDAATARQRLASARAVLGGGEAHGDTAAALDALAAALAGD